MRQLQELQDSSDIRFFVGSKGVFFFRVQDCHVNMREISQLLPKAAASDLNIKSNLYLPAIPKLELYLPLNQLLPSNHFLFPLKI